ncbi:MAG: DNA repair protein RecO [Candidatus Dojkabacteria bacterium]|nr:DNA repair protein RecO [Candidatus Dojkabacteria bacterium]
MSRTYSDKGIVFKQVNIGEADNIVSILTKYHGRVDAVAKGVRKLTSRKSGSIELANLSSFAFAKGRNLDIITEAKTINDYKSLKTSLRTNFYIFFICEVLDNIIKTEDRQKEIFSLTSGLLEMLSTNINLILLCTFILKLMHLSGFDPNLTACLQCGKQLSEDEKKYASSFDLGLLCSREKNQRNKITNKQIKSLRYLRSCSLEDSLKLRVTDNEKTDLYITLLSWLEIIFGKEMKSGKYILKYKE